MSSEEVGQNLHCTLTFIKPKMNDSGLYTVKESGQPTILSWKDKFGQLSNSRWGVGKV